MSDVYAGSRLAEEVLTLIVQTKQLVLDMEQLFRRVEELEDTSGYDRNEEE